MAGIGSLFGALDTALSGLFGSQLRIQVLNHNVANANTPGYSRQRLLLQTRDPLKTTLGSIGRGVEPGRIERITDGFLLKQLYRQQSALGTYAALDDSLSQVELMLGSTDHDRIGTALGSFFDAWSQLATPGTPDGVKESVVTAGAELALHLREVDAQLADLQTELQGDVERQVQEANVLIEDIARLNGEITRHSGPAGLANDLMDQRDRMLEQLSSYVEVETRERGNGVVDVAVGGRPVVAGSRAQTLTTRTESDGDGLASLVLLVGDSDDLRAVPRQGSLAGKVRAHREVLGRARGELDALAAELIDRVNALHRQGATAVGTGVDFFFGRGAAGIEVNSLLTKDSARVATGFSGDAGDRELARLLSELGDATDDAHPLALNERYRGLILSLAGDRASYASMRSGQESIVQGVQARLESVRGVNVDEEMTNIMMLQRAYEANARVVSVVDGMLDTLINGML